MKYDIPYPEKKCPKCDSKHLMDGPHGGLSQNILCPECKSEWNYSPFGYEEIIPARPYLYCIVSPRVTLQICPVGCKSDCRGETYPCLDEVVNIIGQGNVAFMIYSQHVMEKLGSMEYRIDISKHNGIPIGIYISEKGSKSVYERF